MFGVTALYVSITHEKYIIQVGMHHHLWVDFHYSLSKASGKPLQDWNGVIWAGEYATAIIRNIRDIVDLEELACLENSSLSMQTENNLQMFLVFLWISAAQYTITVVIKAKKTRFLTDERKSVGNMKTRITLRFYSDNLLWILLFFLLCPLARHSCTHYSLVFKWNCRLHTSAAG